MKKLLFALVIAGVVAGVLFYGYKKPDSAAGSHEAVPSPVKANAGSSIVLNPSVQGKDGDLTLAIKELEVPQQVIQLKLPKQPDVNTLPQPVANVVLPTPSQEEAPAPAKMKQVDRQTAEARQAVRAQEMMLYRKQFSAPQGGRESLKIPSQLPASTKQ